MVVSPIGRQVDRSLERIAELEDGLLSIPVRAIADVAVLLRWIEAAISPVATSSART